MSFLDHSPGQPLSPSSLLSLDGYGLNSMEPSTEDGVDLFRYYMQFQAKDSPSNTNNGTSNASIAPSFIENNDNSNLLSPYNAFFNPSAYSVSPKSSSLDSSTSDPSGSTAPPPGTLFPFAEASSFTQESSTLNPMQSLNNNDYNAPPPLLSFDHLAGSENPQPIDPHLLFGNGSASLPSVKQEDLEHNPPSFSFFPADSTAPPSAPLSGHLPLSHSNANNNATITPSSNRRSKSASASAQSHNDENMNGIDGMSDESASEQDDDEEEEERNTLPKKRAAASASKKRTSTSTRASSSNKKTTSSSHSRKESSVVQQSHPHALVPVPEWEDRPSKAEYDKLSSKEKRQMRNKISARNFRHRRKAHIDTLEALVNEKDGVIRVLSEEVGTLRTENQGLRADIELLKKNWESIAAKIGAASSSASTSAIASTSSPAQSHAHSLTPDEDDLYGAPGSLPALSPAASSSAESTNGDHLSELSFEHARPNVPQAQAQASQARPSTSTSSSSGNGKRVTRSSIQRPNLRKDLGPSGASFSSSAFGLGRSMNVHTTLIPELNFNFPIPPPSVFSSTSSSPALNGNVPLPSIDGQASSNAGRTPSPPMSSAASIADMLAGKRDRDANTNTANARLNMNPALNGLTPEQIANLREQFFNANSGLSAPASEYENPANVVSGKINRNGAALDPLQNSFFDSNPFISLRQDSLQDYRAQLYAKLANNVAGIHQAQQQQQPAQGDKSSNGVAMNGLRPAFFANAPISSNTTTNEADHQEVVKIANIAQKTLFDKLSTAFWDAFAGNNTLPAKSMVPPSSPSAITGAKRGGSNAGHGDVDGQKVADIIAGRSRLQVVKKNDDADLENLTHRVGNMELKK